MVTVELLFGFRCNGVLM